MSTAKLVKVPDAAETLALSPKTIWQWIGELECLANSVPVGVRQTGMEGALNGTRKAAYS